MLWKRLVALYNQVARRPWRCWGGCTDPSLARYVMDYALGWLDNPEAVPELADRAHELKIAFEAHLSDCAQCQENARVWRTASLTQRLSPELLEESKR